MSGFELRDELLKLDLPIREKLADLGKSLNVSKQYIHQIIQKFNIPYVPYKREAVEHKCRICFRSIKSVNSYRRIYCDNCYGELIKNGQYFKCEVCRVKVYRNKAQQRKMGQNAKVFCSRKHYDLWRSPSWKWHDSFN